MSARERSAEMLRGVGDKSISGRDRKKLGIEVAAAKVEGRGSAILGINDRNRDHSCIGFADMKCDNYSFEKNFQTPM